ncbi:HU family DNA-binding protein [Mariniplasma anaerobium]|uniref:Uncharacterized protein n=1 Tax=Mariniplasma anaerobium TaxID=2735436 RepID=A0A7U9TJ93_9MOLU|nr:HU family DNA-binding protein [Mariniplasma anaerobium]BCR35195.1 hypothetical protein MPAN_000880 [Mariniplasma anaerobium]
MAKAKYKPEENMKSIDQLTIAKQIADELSLHAPLVTKVIELEQKLTMQYVKEGYKIIKKNYVSFTPVKKPGFKMTSKLNGQTYEIPERLTVKVRLGQGFKAFVADGNGKMPDKICRFVDGKEVKEVAKTTVKKKEPKKTKVST